MSVYTSALPHGTRLLGGAFAVGAVLGRGGFGITYKGGDLHNRRYVAIKEFFPQGAVRQGHAVAPSVAAEKYAQSKTDFEREAQTLARFSHPGIVRVLSCFEENNSAYMVMEFLEGPTLAQRITSKNALDEWEVLNLGLRLADALQTVHDAGILHRDVKPANVILARGGHPVLIDFGTARDLSDATGHMTQIVTPGYAPLEQYAAQARRGPATDLYALGATLYHAICGEAPAAATDRMADVTLPHLRERCPQITPALAEAIMSALELEMARRPTSAREFAARLEGRASSSKSFALPKPAPVSGYGFSLAPDAEGLAESEPPSIQMSQRAPATNGEQVENSPGFFALHSKLERHTSSVNALAFDRTRPHLVSGGVARVIHVWNWERDALKAFFGGHEQTVTTLAVSPDGVWLASGGRDAKVCIWDAALPPQKKRAPLAILEDCGGVVHRVAFCPARRELLVCDAGALTLWDAESGQIKTRRDFNAPAASWSPDGTLLALGEVLSGQLHLCDGADLSPRGQLAAHRGELLDVAFSPDGTLLASAGSDGFVRVWRVTEGTLAWQQRAASQPASCLAWSPDGRLLASASRDTTYLWTAEGQLWRRFKKHDSPIQLLAFAPNSNWPYRYVLASASRDKTIGLCRIKCDSAP